MKKLTYLFLALLIVACSDDDSSEQQTFLQKYNGVTWTEEEVLTEEQVNYWTVLSTDGFNEGEGLLLPNGNIQCVVDAGGFYAWGVDYDGIKFEIIENSPDVLRLQVTVIVDDDYSVEAIFTHTVSNNDNILNREIITSSSEIISTYNRNNSFPCPE